jgi:hypothetical protein
MKQSSIHFHSAVSRLLHTLLLSLLGKRCTAFVLKFVYYLVGKQC